MYGAGLRLLRFAILNFLEIRAIISLQINIGHGSNSTKKSLSKSVSPISFVV